MTRCVTPSASFEQFSNAFLSIWKRPSRRECCNIGLAVSGGVDSMALALLCKDFEHRSSGEINLHAFVVDHKSRKESTSEANETREKLQSIGIRTSILPLQWGDGTDPSSLGNFETRARIARYQALSRACCESAIQYLCLAHHEDDQVETIMMRMMNGYTGLGLRAMKPIATLPESLETFGAQRSLLRDQPMSYGSIPPRNLLASVGVTVLRPLLRFKKSSLIAVCREAGVSWAEDSSNSDRTWTQRNAIRYLLLNHTMPKSLSRSSVLGLACKMETGAASLFKRASELLKKMNISLDIRSGILRFVVPANVNRSRQDFLVYGMAIKRLIQLLQTSPAVANDLLDRISNIIFSDVTARSVLPKRFSSARLSWNLLNPVLEKENGVHWSIHREPFKRYEPEPICRWSGSETKISAQSNAASCDKWQLFDGRFWIKVDTAKADVVARLFRESDMAILRRTLPSKSLTSLESILKTAAPGKIKWTLPVLTTHDNQTLFALPSFGINFGEGSPGVNWEVAYQSGDSQHGELVHIIH